MFTFKAHNHFVHPHTKLFIQIWMYARVEEQCMHIEDDLMCKMNCSTIKKNKKNGCLRPGYK